MDLRLGGLVGFGIEDLKKGASLPIQPSSVRRAGHQFHQDPQHPAFPLLLAHVVFFLTRRIIDFPTGRRSLSGAHVLASRTDRRRSSHSTSTLVAWTTSSRYPYSDSATSLIVPSTNARECSGEIGRSGSP
jgi:hypothetical protein